MAAMTAARPSIIWGPHNTLLCWRYRCYAAGYNTALCGCYRCYAPEASRACQTRPAGVAGASSAAPHNTPLCALVEGPHNGCNAFITPRYAARAGLHRRTREAGWWAASQTRDRVAPHNGYSRRITPCYAALLKNARLPERTPPSNEGGRALLCAPFPEKNSVNRAVVLRGREKGGSGVIRRGS